MPIHLIWGDNSGAAERSIEQLIKDIIEPAWNSVNLTRLNGSDDVQSKQALEEILTPPFGSGGRAILIKESIFCNNCPIDLANLLEETINLIPDTCHLILYNKKKPDSRLKTTKALRNLINQEIVFEKSFILPAIWDEVGQCNLIDKTIKELGFEIESEAKFSLLEAIGNDTSRLYSEIKKLVLYEESQVKQSSSLKTKLVITKKAVNQLVGGQATNSLKVADSLLAGDVGEVISKIDSLIESGEPPLRIVATLTNQIRVCLWVSLLDKESNADVSFIAKSAGISNPKRVYVIRKQIRGRSPKLFLELLGCLLEIESSLKHGAKAKNAFRDGLLRKL